jgi:hypothetical protein
MAELAHGTQPEFWRPPSATMSEVALQDAPPTMAEACPRCGTEYLLGSRFCHTCGGKRPLQTIPAQPADAMAAARFWEQIMYHSRAAVGAIPWNRIQFPGWLRHLHFHAIKSRLGLPTASLIAFFIGLGCVTGALLVGLLTARTLVDWQAIQFYRAEWLLGATAAFVAGVLLKTSKGDRD